MALEPYVQQWPKLITWREWLEKAHPDAPSLPWRADDGSEICSFAILAVEGTGGLLVTLYDAHGREVVMTGQHAAAIEATALALNHTPNELAFFPVPRVVPAPR